MTSSYSFVSTNIDVILPIALVNSRESSQAPVHSQVPPQTYWTRICILEKCRWFVNTDKNTTNLDYMCDLKEITYLLNISKMAFKSRYGYPWSISSERWYKNNPKFIWVSVSVHRLEMKQTSTLHWFLFTPSAT